MTNPFPGLRPFDDNAADTEVFFGRDGQVDELLARLHRQRFVAVVGESGCGKSSLVRAGLLPALRGGFLSGAGSRWRIGLMRPGSSPMASLAEALDLPQDVLESGSLGLVQAVQNERLREGENVLLVVDQFEELFRFRHSGSSAHASDEAAAFVKLLLNAAAHRDVPVYVLITMRSDFIGECARFRELPETLNEGLYLVPRLTRDQLREVIEGPVHMRDAEIEPRLVNRILNDLGDDPDQLPLLQVALMCMWNYWEARKKPEEPLGLEDYLAVGGLTDALSQQGDAILRNLPSERARTISSRMFKALTDSGSDNRGIRRPLDLATLAPVVAASEEELGKVIDVWRAPGVSFLMPPAGTKLESGTVIDLTHEALMRAWDTLRAWVSNEAESAKLYRRLLEGAQMHERGRGMLLADPTLKFAEEWRDEEHPNEAWAARYGGGLASVLALIAASRRAEDSEAESERRAQRRTRAIAVVMSIVALLALGGLAYAGFENHRAHLAEIQSKQLEQKANQELRERIAAQQKMALTQKNLKVALIKAQSETKIAQDQTKLAQRETQLAKSAQIRQQQMASDELRTSRQHAAEAGSALLARVDDDLYSAAFSDWRILGLVAVNSYVLNPSPEAREQLLEAAVSPGSLGRVALPPWNLGAVTGHGAYVAVLAGAQQNAYAAPVSGELLLVDARTLAILNRRPRVSGTLMCGFDSSARFAVANGNAIDLYDAAASGIPLSTSLKTGTVAALACSPQSDTLYYVDAAGALRGADVARGTTWFVGSTDGGVNGLTLSPGEKYAAVTASDGNVTLFDLQAKKRLGATKLLPDQRHDCYQGGCGGAVAFDSTEKMIGWYDGGAVHRQAILGSDDDEYPCAAAMCDHPTLFFQHGATLPEVVAEDVAGCCTTKHAYYKDYIGGSGAARRVLYDPELALFVAPYNPSSAREPNPLGGGLAEGAMVREDAPMVGRFVASGLSGSYALRGNQVLLAADRGFIASDLDARQSLEHPLTPSSSLKLRDSGDGKHGISFNYNTGEVRVLDLRPATPAVLHRFFVAPIAKDKSGVFVGIERIAYDPRTETVTLATEQSVDRYTAAGRQFSTQPVATLMQKGGIAKLSSIWLSQRGNYVTLTASRSSAPSPAAGTTHSAALFRPDGTLLGVFNSLDGISTDERYLFAIGAGVENGTEQILELPSLTSVGITAIPGTAEDLAMSPDGRTIAYDSTKNDYKGLYLYDVRSLTSYRFGLPQPPALSTYRDIAFSQDGRHLLATYEDKDGSDWTAVYSVDPDVWARTACLESGRPLNASEFRAVTGNNAPFVNGCAAFESQMYRW